jgi:late competence protein required for DNA uptake (superfamily II DNA/RNA helicase)
MTAYEKYAKVSFHTKFLGYIYCRNCLMENLAVQRQQYEQRLHEWHMEQSEKERVSFSFLLTK